MSEKIAALDETIELVIGDDRFTFPVVTGVYDEKGIDISKLRGQTKYVTLDLGFKNTGSTQSAITFIDGEKGILEHRGYRIEELAKKASFPEIMHLLLKDKLPNKAELADFNGELNACCAPPEGVKAILNALPDGTHPMGMLSAVLSSLTGFYPDSMDSWSNEDVRWKTIYRLLGNMSGICAYIYRRSKGLDYIDADPSLDYVSNFLHMMFGKVDPDVAEAIDTLLILHADHEQNCSAATVRLVGSSGVNLFAAIAAGNNSLWGPLHGGANQKVMEMLAAIQRDGGDTAKYIQKAKSKEDPFRLMGFGHRVYKNYDPRAKVIKSYADKILSDLESNDPILDVAMGLEKEALNDEYFQDRKLFPNVDFYSGIIYQALGIPVNMYTVMFALGRATGWISQWMEMRQDGQPIGRPRQIYIGESTRAYVPLEDRG